MNRSSVGMSKNRCFSREQTGVCMYVYGVLDKQIQENMNVRVQEVSKIG